MTNRERYEEEILQFALLTYTFAVRKSDSKIVPCYSIQCDECAFRENSKCINARKKWLSEEYVEKISISKRDRDFLFYLSPSWNYMVRGEDNNLWVCDEKPVKKTHGWTATTTNFFKITPRLQIDFPMVKWEDSEPWNIADFYGLEVIEKYNGKTD